MRFGYQKQSTLPTTTTTITPTTTVPPIVVSLIGFNTVPGSNTIILGWSTASEINNAGFNLYRADKEKTGTGSHLAGLLPKSFDSRQ
jgi:hypothetical protein